jgi:hypothetical protein
MLQFVREMVLENCIQHFLKVVVGSYKWIEQRDLQAQLMEFALEVDVLNYFKVTVSIPMFDLLPCSRITPKCRFYLN